MRLVSKIAVLILLASHVLALDDQARQQIDAEVAAIDTAHVMGAYSHIVVIAKRGDDALLYALSELIAKAPKVDGKLEEGYVQTLLDKAKYLNKPVSAEQFKALQGIANADDPMHAACLKQIKWRMDFPDAER
jgi:hypothetical protein